MTVELDPIAVLIEAWVAWDKAAANMPRFPTAQTLDREARAKEAALEALGIDSTHAHITIAAIRHAAPSWIEGGLSVPDAVQAYLNDHYHPMKEAS